MVCRLFYFINSSKQSKESTFPLPLAVNAARTPLFILSLARALGRTAGSFQLPSLIRGVKDIGAMPTPSQRRARRGQHFA